MGEEGTQLSDSWTLVWFFRWPRRDRRTVATG